MIKNYPEYETPYFWKDCESFKGVPEIYEDFKKQNEEYPHKVSQISSDIAKFRNQLKEFLDKQFDDFYDEYVIKLTK